MRKPGVRTMTMTMAIAVLALAGTGLGGWMYVRSQAPSEVRAPLRARADVFPGVGAGEVVYQAADGSIHAVKADGKGDRRLADKPPLPHEGDRPGRIMGWVPERGVALCITECATEGGDGSVDQSVMPFYLYDLTTRRVTPVTGEGPGLRSGHRDQSADLSLDRSQFLYFSSWDYRDYAIDVTSGVSSSISTGEAGFTGVAEHRRRLWPGPNEGWEGPVLAVSPDRTLLLTGMYIDVGDGDGPSSRIFLFDTRSKQQKQLPVPAAISDVPSDLLMPSFSSDGLSVTFEQAFPQNIEVLGKTMRNAIWVVSVDGSSAKRVATGTAPVFWPGR